MSDDATPRDVPAEEGACMPRSEHAKPSDESALATRVPSPAHREKATTSKYRGVRQRTDARRGSWTADIRGPNGKRLHLGRYDTAEEAATAYDAAAREFRGANAKTNFQLTPGEEALTRAALCAGLAAYGHLECLKEAHENGCQWNEMTCIYAAEGGHLACLKYAHENGCPWPWDHPGVCNLAAEGGHLECLKYAHENGCPWNELTCRFAAIHGHLECLKYLHENGCQWDEPTCRFAARYGYLACLKYAHENGCPWDESVCRAAHIGGDSDCMQYVHENGCPWDDDVIEAAAFWLLYRREKFDSEEKLESRLKCSYSTARAVLERMKRGPRDGSVIWNFLSTADNFLTVNYSRSSSAHVAGTTLQWGTRRARTKRPRVVTWSAPLETNLRTTAPTNLVDMATRRYCRYWTQEEEDALREGIYKHGKRWEDIKNDPTFSQILKNRSPKGMTDKWCYIEKREGKRPRVLRRWTQEEEDALREGIDKHGKRWEDIKNDPTFSQILKIRSLKDISGKRFYIETREGKRPPPKVIRRWTREEEDALREGVDKHGRRWAGIQNDPTFSQILKNHSQKDMASKWCKLEKREGKRTRLGLRRWTQEEEDALRTGVDKHGRRWVDIKNDPTLSQILENRSPRDLTMKWRYLQLGY